MPQAIGAETPEQTALRESVRELLARGPGDSLWFRLAGQMGLAALAVPESAGGAGAGLAEVAVVVEELGRALVPVPYLSTALAAAVLGEGDERAAATFLPALVSGAGTAALALHGDVRCTAGRLDGVADHVLDGGGAGTLLVRVGTEVHVARATDADVTRSETLDQTRGQASVRFRQVPAVRTGLAADRVEQLAQVLLAVESVGGAEHCLAATVAYLKIREQFGRPIGSFQALKHRCADLAAEVASAGATARAAVAAAGGADPATAELPVLAPLAKRYCAEVFLHVAAEMIQLHGGIGFTWEHEAHRYFKRAKSTQLLYGTPAELRRVIGTRAGLTG
ncbi:MAG TPA: acyl-CoA dehydrogenase family protein [Mycobacteriales bacterium]|nr:acyl-CoA dehydrogenase family protein [Mycobacteriales bacterium]